MPKSIATNKLLFLTIVVLSNFAEQVVAQQTIGAHEKQRLQKKLEEVANEHNLPGIVVAAVRSDEIITTQAFGVRKRGTDDQIQLTDRFPIGSNTKSMTATLAAIVVESGKIRWDTTIGEVWPQFSKKRLHPKMKDVTLEDLLAHQSGLPRDFDRPEWASFFQEKNSPAKERRRMLKLCLSDKSKNEKGSYLYSNLGYVIAAAMLEEVTDQDYETMMRDKIFDPLKMESAMFRTNKTANKLKEPLLWGHRQNGAPISPKVLGSENPSVYASVGTVNVSVGDYAKYAQWHLNEKPSPLLDKQETVDYLHNGIARVGRGSAKYGNGWIHFRSAYGRTMQHSGSNTNTFALIWVLPEKDLAAIACTNTYEKSHFQACDAAIAEMLKMFAR